MVCFGIIRIKKDLNMVYIVTATRNRKDLLDRYLQSLQKQIYKDIKIIIIDDGSDDGTDILLKQKYPEIIYVKGNGNLWWTGATRLGVNKAQEFATENDFILIQNDDTYIKPDFIQKLVELSEKYNRMILGTTVYEIDSDKIVYNSCKLINGTYRPTIVEDSKSEIIETETISGRGVLIPIEVFVKIGNYSSILPHYGADYEFILRAKRNGFKIGMTGEVITYSTKSNSLNLSSRIKQKENKSFEDFYNLFFHRKSSNQLWPLLYITFLYVPFPLNIYGVLRIFSYCIKFLFIDVIWNSINIWKRK